MLTQYLLYVPKLFLRGEDISKNPLYSLVGVLKFFSVTLHQGSFLCSTALTRISMFFAEVSLESACPLCKAILFSTWKLNTL